MKGKNKEVKHDNEGAAEDPSPGRILLGHADRRAPPELHRLGSQTDVPDQAPKVVGNWRILARHPEPGMRHRRASHIATRTYKINHKMRLVKKKNRNPSRFVTSD